MCFSVFAGIIPLSLRHGGRGAFDTVRPLCLQVGATTSSAPGSAAYGDMWTDGRVNEQNHVAPRRIEIVPFAISLIEVAVTVNCVTLSVQASLQPSGAYDVRGQMRLFRRE